MCLPWTAIAAAASAISTVTTVITGKQTAKAQEAAQNQALEAETKRSAAEVAAIRQKEAQEKEAQARDAQRILQQSKRAMATAKVSALESGASAKNMDMILGEFKRQELGYIEGVQRQGEVSDIQYDMAVENALNQSVSNQININQPVSAPSFLEIPLGIAKAGVQYKTNKKLIG